MSDKFMGAAIREARKGMLANRGGPFGAVVVRNGRILSRAHNRVIISSDPTAHAEILAIGKASKKLKRFDLSDCELFSTCEPCPMCLAEIHWARITRLYYGCTRKDAARAGFADDRIYQLFQRQSAGRSFQRVMICRDRCLPIFLEWEKKADKIPY
jgi:guanine deaminase